MGLGRREFIRLSGLILAGLTIDPLKAVVVNNNFYINKKLGIICEKPSDWDFVSVADYGRLLNDQIFPNEFEINKEENYEEIGWSDVIISKYVSDTPENKGRFSPTILVDVNHKSEINLKCKNLKEFIEYSSYAASGMLKDFQRISLKGPVSISSYDTYILESTYTLEHVELKEPMKANLKVIFIEHNNFYYIFNMHDIDQANEQATFDKFLGTIKLI